MRLYPVTLPGRQTYIEWAMELLTETHAVEIMKQSMLGIMAVGMGSKSNALNVMHCWGALACDPAQAADSVIAVKSKEQSMVGQQGCQTDCVSKWASWTLSGSATSTGAMVAEGYDLV